MGSLARLTALTPVGWRLLAGCALSLLGCSGEIVDSGPSPHAAPSATGGSPASTAAEGGSAMNAQGGSAGTRAAGGGSGMSTQAGGAGVPACAAAASDKPGLSARIRRLTRLEVENTLGDLLGEATRPLALDLESDTFAIGYSTGDERSVSSNYVEALKSVAERATLNLKAAPEKQALGAACFVDAASSSACARTFIADFGARALRRPVATAELEGLLSVYSAGRATVAAGDERAALDAGLDYAVRALLESSNFLFRTELGEPGASGASVALTPYETASILSYALTASPPDAELTEQARSSALLTQAELVTQARRLLAAYPERFERQAERFVREWLAIDLGSPVWNKSAALYPEASPGFKAALDKETELFLRDWARNASLTELLTKPRSFVSKGNAPAYGLSVTSSEFTAVALDPGQRAGILTLPSFLGSRAHSDASSPVQRGIAVMKKLLCLEPPPVPNMVPPLPPADKNVVSTTRERFEQHTSLPACAGCHGTFDPMGFPFEHYDAIGRYRDQENGAKIDSSGAIVGTLGSNAKVSDAIDLAKQLSASPEVHACFVRHAYRFTLGRIETDANTCALATYAKQFDDLKLNVRELMLALVTDPAALRRVPLTPEP